MLYQFLFFFFFQAEDGIRDLVRSRGLGDVYKRQVYVFERVDDAWSQQAYLKAANPGILDLFGDSLALSDDGNTCLLYTSDAADERSSVDLGGRRIIQKKKTKTNKKKKQHRPEKWTITHTQRQ